MPDKHFHSDLAVNWPLRFLHTGPPVCTRHGAHSACPYSYTGSEADETDFLKTLHIHLEAAGGGRAYNRLVQSWHGLRRSLMFGADGKKVSIEGILDIASTTSDEC